MESKNHNEIPSILNEIDVGVFFIEPAYSKIASAPTKFGEFLAMGIPCVTNAKIGDMDFILQDKNLGLAMNKFDENSFEFAAKEIINLIKQKDTFNSCRKAAEKYFSLSEGANKYSQLYKQLVE